MNDNFHDKPRMSEELQTLHYLHLRNSLSSEDIQRYDTLQKGYEGEMKLYNLVTSTDTKGYFRFDFLFSSNGTEFQIDSLAIDDQTITLFEVKHYAGDFIHDHNQWYLASNKQEIRNPLIQLQRSEFLFRHLLRDTYPNVTIKAKLVFVHEEFMLYQAPLGIPAIFPNQLNRFLSSISSPKKYISKRVSNIANHLASLHMSKSAYAKKVTYTYETVKKGIPCTSKCRSFLEKYAQTLLHCPTCGITLKNDDALFAIIKEFYFLFPERNITTGAIHEWSNYTLSKRKILHFLNKHLKSVKKGRFTHYYF